MKNSKDYAKMNLLTDLKIIELLGTCTKSTTIAVEYVVDESDSRTIKGEKQVQKRVFIGNLFLNHDYAKKVQNLTDNKDFEAHEMKGKSRISTTFVLSEKTNNILLDGKILKSESVKHLAYYHNGNEITEDEGKALNLFTPNFYNKDKQKTSGRGSVSVEDDFRMITLGITKIKYLKCFGEEYAR
jgi:hypothetical protein